MTTKEELATWTKAVDLFNNKKEKGAKEAIKLFSYIDKYSKVLFNIGMIYLAINDCENADVLFGKALLTDKYFGAAYFQKGVALFYLYEYDLALRCYEFCLDVSDQLGCMGFPLSNKLL
jgi:tetratricopeptide (TPR) repeat protein